MPWPKIRNTFVLFVALSAGVLSGVGYFFWSLSPRAMGGAESVHFEVRAGQGLKEIADGLVRDGIIRQAASFKFFAVVTGQAGSLKPGRYELFPTTSASEILDLLVRGRTDEVTVLIPEGASVYHIDSILSEAGVIGSGELIAYSQLAGRRVEGYLFPDQYRFYRGTPVAEVVDRLVENLQVQVGESLPKDATVVHEVIIMASMLEREVPEEEDRRLVAGILAKRRATGMPLQVDATVCYAQQVIRGAYSRCHPLSLNDLRVESPYNTYLYKGFPAGPIGNPGRAAILAALAPRASDYWFYLSDPVTQNTIFSKTLDEHNRNKVKYLK